MAVSVSCVRWQMTIYIGKLHGIEVSRVKVDWGEAPDVSIFYGRESDLGDLGSLFGF